jgi:beta-aspartyl-peptidase (threonine type)
MHPSPPRWSLVIHGGSGRMVRATMSAVAEADYRAGLSAALAAGEAILAADGSALDAVEAAVIVLEDHPGFNAGRGAVRSPPPRRRPSMLEGSLSTMCEGSRLWLRGCCIQQ